MLDVSIWPLPSLSTKVEEESLINIASEIGIDMDEKIDLMRTGRGGEILKDG